MSSPRAWGCFSYHNIHITPCNVFPTRVGVFLHRPGGGVMARSLPHARGGVSIRRPEDVTDPTSSPRAWGCF